MTDLADFIEQAYEGLRLQLEKELGEIWEEKKDTLKRFATHVGLLNWRIYRQERIDTAASALEDVLQVGIPALRLELRYKFEEAAKSTFFTTLGSFFQGVLSIAIAAGKAYLQSSELDFLGSLREKVKEI